MPFLRLLVHILLPLFSLSIENATVPFPDSSLQISLAGPDMVDFFRASYAPDGTRLARISFGGSGCPADTAYHVVRNSSLSFYTPSFTAAGGPGRSLMDARKFCQVNVDVVLPEGWQMALKIVESAGYVSIGENVDGTVLGTSYFSGLAEQVGALSRKGAVC